MLHNHRVLIAAVLTVLLLFILATALARRAPAPGAETSDHQMAR